MQRSVHSLLTASFVLASLLASAQKSPFTYMDMLMLDRISELSVDPTGHYALFNVRSTDMEAN